MLQFCPNAYLPLIWIPSISEVRWLSGIGTTKTASMLLELTYRLMLCVVQVIDRLEATMRLKRFNQLGGLQLDRDVRILTSTLADITQQAVRDHFARLNQMATILSLESVAEFLDYWGESSTISWRFGEAQVREILQQRIDFLQDQIAALPLYM